MSWFFTLDGNILLWIQEYLRNDFLSPIMKGVSFLGNSGWFWIVLSILLCIPKKTRWIGITGAFALIFSFLISNVCLKNWVARIRPYEVVDGLQRIVSKEKEFSFPSGHASASFAAAVAYYKVQKKEFMQDPWKKYGKIFGITAIVLACLISFSRLYVGVHYPTDVIAGILIGCFSAWVADILVQFIKKRFNLRKNKQS